MIKLKYVTNKNTLPANSLKPWQVFITVNNSVLTRFENRTVSDFSFYPSWLARKFINNDITVISELFRLYQIHQQYNVLELIGIKDEIFISCIKRILDNSIIGGQDVYRQRPNC